ncbi:MAG: PQQ-binding-like beta-propeller repeat protein [Candidatus Hydrogenedentes bacterium]|nr:PQQ-binding-like beta-propeller repeat protein [Candidatus Hydrogenedentota bacterium]
MRIRIVLLVAAVAGCFSLCAAGQHRVLLQGEDRLLVVEKDGSISWEMKWGGIHDIHRLENGHILVQDTMQKVSEIDPETRQVVWTYDAGHGNGNDGKKVEVHAFQPLPGDRLMIAESGPGRIIEIDRMGKVLKAVKLVLDAPDAHRDTRLARKLGNGHYLVCHEGDGKVREYDEAGAVVWDFAAPLFGKTPKPGHGPEAFGNAVFSAVRLENGNTLIGAGNGHALLEVSPDRQIVWELHQNDLPGITLAWVTTVEVLPNGNIVFGNCHAGPGQPLLIEIAPRSKQAIWQLDRHADFGNNVSNSVLLDAGATLR